MPLEADSPHSGSAKAKRPLELMRERLELRNYTHEAEKTCISWAWGYIVFHDERRAARPRARVPSAARAVRPPSLSEAHPPWKAVHGMDLQH